MLEGGEATLHLGAVLLHQPMELSAKTLSRHLHAHGAAEVTVDSADFDLPAVVVLVDGVAMAVMALEHAWPNNGLREAAQRTLLWADAEAALDSHGAHVVVSALQKVPAGSNFGIAENVRIARALSQTIAAVIELGDAAAVYWANASHLVDPDRFIAGVRNPYPPTDCWLGLEPFRACEEAAFGIVTRGLIAFTGYELSCPAGTSGSEPIHEALGLSQFLLSDGPTFAVDQDDSNDIVLEMTAGIGGANQASDPMVRARGQPV